MDGTDTQWKSQTSYTALCNGIIGYWNQFWDLLKKKVTIHIKTNAKQITNGPMISMPHAACYEWLCSCLDGSWHTYQRNHNYLNYGKTSKVPKIEPHTRDTNGTGSGSPLYICGAGGTQIFLVSSFERVTVQLESQPFPSFPFTLLQTFYHYFCDCQCGILPTKYPVNGSIRWQRAIEYTKLSFESFWNVITPSTRLNHSCYELDVHYVGEVTRLL